MQYFCHAFAIFIPTNMKTWSHVFLKSSSFWHWIELCVSLIGCTVCVCVCVCVRACTHAKLLQLCPTLCHAMDCSPPDSSVHGILQARMVEWVAISSFSGSSWPRDRTRGSWIAGSFFTTEPLGSPGCIVPIHKVFPLHCTTLPESHFITYSS